MVSFMVKNCVWFYALKNECLYSVFEKMIVLFFDWKSDFACVLCLKD
jgi:hypothetical protein